MAAINDKPLFDEDDDDDDIQPSPPRGDYDEKSDDEIENSDEENVNNSEDEDDDGSESDESGRDKDISAKKSGKRSSSHLSSSKSKKKSRREKPKSRVSRFFDDEAVDNDDSEEEEDGKPIPGEVIVPEDELRAIEAVDMRHRKNREFLNSDAAAIAERYIAKARDDRANRFSDIYDQPIMTGGRVGTVFQQSLLPSISDPSLWRFKVLPGKEQMLVMSIMRKALDSKMRGGPLRIKSAFCSSSKGYIYVEAVGEPLVKEAIYGLRGIYQSTMKKVAVHEMTAVLNVKVQKTPLTVNQWARVSRGPLKGDLVRIVMLYEGGSKVMIQAVPRPDYNEASVNAAKSLDKHSAAAKARPPQRLFEPTEVVKGGGECFPKPNPDDRSSRYEFWRNEYYKDGYLCKVVNPDTYLHTTNVKPRVEEQKMFLNTKSKGRGDGYEDEDADEDEDEEVDNKASQSLLNELAGQLHGSRDHDDGGKLKASPFIVGDMVQVTGGELRNLVARVTKVNELLKSVTVVPVSHSGLASEFSIETALLVKYVTPGEHVKVIYGPHIGQTGTVVAVHVVEGRPMAAVMTDGVNTEIQCDVSHVQISSEVTTGLGNLMGYELYDLVAINDNESACVIVVGSEKLSVINNMDIVKDVYPQELQQKKNFQSQRSSGFDKNQNTVTIGDVVNVVEGPYHKKSGTVKHVMKGTLWLHSNTHLKNSGIFVVRARFCVVAGIKAQSMTSMMGPPALPNRTANATTTSAGSIGTKVSVLAKPNSKVARDPSIGVTIRITKGPFKGHLAQVIDATSDHFSVELLSKMKKISIERNKTVVVGDKSGEHNANNGQNTDGNEFIPSEKFLTGDTPQHYAMHDTPSRAMMNATPSHGGDMTPFGARTPGRSADDIWSVNAKDGLPTWSEAPTFQGSDYGTDSGSRLPSNSHVSSSPWSIGEGSISSASYQAQNFGQSSKSANSPLSSGTYSPFSAQPSPMPYGGDGVSRASRDWVVNMVVTFKQGPFTGKNAVIRKVPDEHNSRFKVSIRDNTGRLAGSAFDIDANEVVPAEPGIKTRVFMLAGQFKGKYGIVKNTAGSDLVVSLQDAGTSAPFIAKRVDAAWIS